MFDPERQEDAPLVDDKGAYDYGHNDDGQARLEDTPACQDMVWAILFVVHLLIIFGLFAMGVRHLIIHNAHGLGRPLTLFFIGSAVGVIGGIAWIQVIKNYAAQIIQFMLIATSVLLAVMTVLALLSGQFLMFILSLIFTVLFVLFAYGAQSRIPFASAVLAIAAIVIQTYNGIIISALFFGVVLVIWTLLWGVMFAAALTLTTASAGIVLLFLLSLYWTWQVLKNCSHVTTAGVTATWYFCPIIQSPTIGAIRRAMTTSFGSICLGSLIVALLELLQAIIRSANNNGEESIITCICLCILDCIENLVQYFNVYAFSEVAIYGYPYVEAATRTWELFKYRGFDAIVNDDLTYLVVLAGAFAVGICGGLIGAGVASAMHLQPAGGGVVGFIVALIACDIVLTCVRSAVVTIFVCWVEDPAALTNNHPEEHRKITDAWDARNNR